MAVLQSKSAANTPADHAVVPFLTEYIGEPYNRTNIGPDGRTPYRRIKRKRLSDEGCPVWRKVLYKRGKPRKNMNKLEERIPGRNLGRRYSELG